MHVSVIVRVENVDDLIVTTIEHVLPPDRGITQMSTTGGDVLRFVGLNFGYLAPDAAQSVVRVSYMRAEKFDENASATRYHAHSCKVTERNTAIECRTSAGVGIDLQWWIEVDGLERTVEEQPLDVGGTRRPRSTR